jgi:ABC-type polysaccharide/polyol phosphate export permease
MLEENIEGRHHVDRFLLRSRPVEILPNVSIWRRGIDDLSGALAQSRIILLLGSDDVASRYRRSALGQFWFTLSNALFIITVGVVWASIWKQPVEEFLPYFAAGHVFWTLMAVSLIDATSTFSNSAPYLRELNFPRSTYLFANTTKHFIILMHNLVIIPVVFLIFGRWPSYEIFLFIPALFLTMVTILVSSFWLGIIGLRFRDVPGLMSSLMMVLFFLTPVIWREEVIDQGLRDLLVLNPFHVFLELLRAPLLGYGPKSHYWLLGLSILIINSIMGFVVFAKWRRSVTYWL